MAVIAFDFDGVLSTLRMQDFAKKLIKEGNEVWICTARVDNGDNLDLFQVCNKIGLHGSHVIFTDRRDKWEILKGINADIYIDDNELELLILNHHTNCIGVLFKEN